MSDIPGKPRRLTRSALSRLLEPQEPLLVAFANQVTRRLLSPSFSHSFLG
jgi:hypothetical protein